MYYSNKILITRKLLFVLATVVKPWLNFLPNLFYIFTVINGKPGYCTERNLSNNVMKWLERS